MKRVREFKCHSVVCAEPIETPYYQCCDRCGEETYCQTSHICTKCIKRCKGSILSDITQDDVIVMRFDGRRAVARMCSRIHHGLYHVRIVGHDKPVVHFLSMHGKTWHWYLCKDTGEEPKTLFYQCYHKSIKKEVDVTLIDYDENGHLKQIRHI